MKKISIYILAALAFFAMSCEEPFEPDPVPNAQQVVVEGYIEAGEGSSPISYLIVSETVPFFSEISPEQYATLFLDNARVVVNDGEQDVEYTKTCLSDLPDELKEAAGELLGINTDSTNVDVCIYVDLFAQLVREAGRTYTLEVTFDDRDDVITSSTTIPVPVPLTDFTFRDTPGEPIDGLAQLFCTINDPSEPNYYRYFTDADSTGLIPPFGSVTDDAPWNGQQFEFPLSKAELPTADFDPNTFGMFTEGDTVILKWCTIDKAHFDFWNTFEYARNNQGPFSSYTRIKTNVEGAWGIFGGYGVQVSELVVEK